MEDDQKFITWITGIVCTAAVVLTLGILLINNARTKMFIENGYTRETLQGTQYIQWVKDKE